MAEERIERRLAAILAADVVGYSRLVRADEEATLAVVGSLIADFASFADKLSRHIEMDPHEI